MMLGNRCSRGNNILLGTEPELASFSASTALPRALRHAARFFPVLLMPHSGPSKLRWLGQGVKRVRGGGYRRVPTVTENWIINPVTLFNVESIKSHFSTIGTTGDC